MTRRAWLWSALLALGAAMLALAVRTPAAEPSAGPVRLLDFSPGAVTAVTLTRGGETTRVARTAEGWTLTARGVAWPADESAVRGFLRLLATLEGIAAEGPVDEGAVLAIEREAAPALTLRLSSRSIGGGALADAGAGAVRIDDDLWRIAVETGFEPWRAPGLLPGLAEGVTAVALRAGDRALALRRSGGRWGLTEPMVARADDAAADELVRTLASLRAEGDAPAPATAPVATVVATRTTRTPEGDRRDRVWRLDLHTGGDMAAALVAVARVEEEGAAVLGPRSARLDGSTLAALALDPARYAARTATVARPADVLAVEITAPDAPPRRLARPPGGWDERVQRALSALADPRAEQIGLEPPPAGAVALRLLGLGDAGLGELHAWGDRDALTVYSDGFARGYTGEPAGAIADLIATP